MILQIFALRDRQADMYLNPLFLPSVGMAVRSISDEVNRNGDATNMVSNHPEDFELFHLGAFDTSVARFDLFSDPKSIALCVNLKVKGA